MEIASSQLWADPCSEFELNFATFLRNNRFLCENETFYYVNEMQISLLCKFLTNANRDFSDSHVNSCSWRVLTFRRRESNSKTSQFMQMRRISQELVSVSEGKSFATRNWSKFKLFRLFSCSWSIINWINLASLESLTIHDVTHVPVLITAARKLLPRQL